ncbi:MAG: hypothetical protein ACLQVW_18915 [Limisphaerales bacterium]
MEDFEAALTLNFAYYNFCKLHGVGRQRIRGNLNALLHPGRKISNKRIGVIAVALTNKKKGMSLVSALIMADAKKSRK